MKRDLFIRVSLAAVGILLALNLMMSIFAAPPASHAAKTIEYKVVPIPDSSLDRQGVLDKHGKEGWELVVVWPGASSSFIFRR